MEWPCKKPWLLLVGTMIVLVQEFGRSSGCFPEEKESLLDFKAAYSNETLLPSWVDHPNSNCCDWERVTCHNSSSGHVIHLSLQNSQRIVDTDGDCLDSLASLNWSLFLSFKELRSLNLSDNCFDGFIWKGVNRSKSILKRLETLDLSWNSFNESIMERLTDFTSLKNLILSKNHISGFFPSKELSLLSNLELVDLSYNGLRGPLKVNRSKSILKRLEILDLSWNSVNESIMELLTGFTSLKSLILSGNNISGFFPSKELSLLSNLELVDLSDNGLRGSLKGLCKMKQLEELHLRSNKFGGPLNPCLNNLTSLRVLDLFDNSLSGSIPVPLIASLTSLEYLSLDWNEFEGLFSLNILANHSQLKVLRLGSMDSNTFQVETESSPWNASFQLEHLQISSCEVNLPTKSIPTFLSSQSSLKHIDLSGNNLVGMFPSWLIVNNSKLEEVYLNDNFLTGPFKLPFDLNHRMDQVQGLYISNNKIQGELPETIGFIFPHLVWLDLSSNKFDGQIPASIGEMSDLETLDLANNNFSGKVPEHILDRCIRLWRLLLDNNQLNGTLPRFVGSPSLETLTASRNNFEGPITKEICQLNNLDFIDLSHNRLSSAVPSCFNMTDVSVINLQGNSLTGTIPEALFSSSSTLAFIDLSDNNFSGTIPENIYGLGNLSFLLLAGNRLQGQLSTQICRLRNLQILDLSRNNFTGSIPSCLNKFSFQSGEWIPVDGYANEEVEFIIKGLPHSYTSDMLEIMAAIDLSSNQLTGEIPHQLGYLASLYALNLSHNHLNGSIPGSFHMLQSIESLDLSNNNLSGQIPLQLQDLNYLAVFNVSYNNLSGTAPNKGQFGTFDSSSYEGNPYLCLNNSNRGIAMPQPSPTPLDEGKKDVSAIDFTSFYWSFAASFVTVVIVLVTILWINPYWRRVWFYYVQRCLLQCFGQFFEDAF